MPDDTYALPRLFAAVMDACGVEHVSTSVSLPHG